MGGLEMDDEVEGGMVVECCGADESLVDADLEGPFGYESLRGYDNPRDTLTSDELLQIALALLIDHICEWRVLGLVEIEVRIGLHVPGRLHDLSHNAR